MPDPATLHFFCGKAGAGKSTLAASIAGDTRALLISEDVCMSRLFGDQLHTFDDYVRLSGKLKSVVGPIASDVLSSGRSVVLDFQANTRSGRDWFRSLFESTGSAHVLHVVEATDRTCLARIARRNVARPEGSHHITEEVFHHVTSFFQPPGADEGFNVQIHPERPT
jgi:predicted kinase